MRGPGTPGGGHGGWVGARWGITSLFSRRMTQYAALSRDDVPENLAMMFITFPAAKDPTYEQRHPGTTPGAPLVPPAPLRGLRGSPVPPAQGGHCRCHPHRSPHGGVTGCPRPAGKSCMTILTMARYEWFEEWAGGRPRHRGPEYQRYKMDIAQRLLERALLRFPHLRDKVPHGMGWGVPQGRGAPGGSVRAPRGPGTPRAPVPCRWSSWRRRPRSPTSTTWGLRGERCTAPSTTCSASAPPWWPP